MFMDYKKAKFLFLVIFLSCIISSCSMRFIFMAGGTGPVDSTGKHFERLEFYKNIDSDDLAVHINDADSLGCSGFSSRKYNR